MEDISGTPVDVSGTPVDVSGTTVDVSETPVDVSGGFIESIGESIVIVPPPPPSILSIDDLLSSVELIARKEAEDKATLESIGGMSIGTLKERLMAWAVANFPNNFEVYAVSITPPAKCSDGVSRNLPEYIEYCSGKTIVQHVEALQQKVNGIIFTFANMGTHIAIIAAKA